MALQEAAEDCVAVEDSSNGVRAAREAGMKCIGFKNANYADQDLSWADIVIEDFNAINLSKIELLFYLQCI